MGSLILGESVMLPDQKCCLAVDQDKTLTYDDQANNPEGDASECEAKPSQYQVMNAEEN